MADTTLVEPADEQVLYNDTYGVEGGTDLAASEIAKIKTINIIDYDDLPDHFSTHLGNSDDFLSEIEIFTSSDSWSQKEALDVMLDTGSWSMILEVDGQALGSRAGDELVETF